MNLYEEQANAIARQIDREVEKAIAKTEEKYKKIIERDHPYILTKEKKDYLNILIHAHHIGHECHKEISDVIKDLHKSFGYTGA